MLKKIIIGKTDNSKIHLLRSIFSSGIAFAADFLILILLVEKFHLHYIISGTAGFLTGTTLLYFISVSWIFSSRRIQRKSLEYALFIFLGIIGGILNILFLWVFTDKFAVYYMVSRMIAATLVFFFNYLSRKLLIFTETKN
ncbi:MAG: GtrA family protein [Spirochaetales bacterium]|nr:GtrA family protein [Spirochaetales bacterium]